MKTYFCSQKSHPVNPNVTELSLDERASNYNREFFFFAANRPAKKKKPRYKIAPVAKSLL